LILAILHLCSTQPFFHLYWMPLKSLPLSSQYLLDMKPRAAVGWTVLSYRGLLD
jgi:hypothetical protein